jgi:hypothetical protein
VDEKRRWDGGRKSGPTVLSCARRGGAAPAIERIIVRQRHGSGARGVSPRDAGRRDSAWAAGDRGVIQGLGPKPGPEPISPGATLMGAVVSCVAAALAGAAQRGPSAAVRSRRTRRAGGRGGRRGRVRGPAARRHRGCRCGLDRWECGGDRVPVRCAPCCNLALEFVFPPAVTGATSERPAGTMIP